MKLSAILAGAVLLGGATAASAADLGRGMPVKAPVMAPAYNWSGFYAGLHAGYGWADDPITIREAGPAALIGNGFIPASLGADANGFIGGGQIGWNVQSGAFVWGIEADISYSGMDDSISVTTTVGGAVHATTASKELDWFGTLRARLGTLVNDRSLLYVTGGLAYGHASLDSSITNLTGCAPFGFCGAASSSDTLFGWTLGGGAEFAAGNGWSLKAEYLYFDLGDISQSYTSLILGAPQTYTVSTDVTGHIVRAGVNYKFGAY